MAHYLDILWKDYIGKGDTGVRKDDRTFQKTFWEHVHTVWQTFKQHMEDASDDATIETLCDTHHTTDAGAESSDTFSHKDKAVCWLTLKALGFKHGILWRAPPMHANTLGQPEKQNNAVMPYMKCILVNIFMKKIIGENCLRTPLGNHAFKAATALVREGKKAEPNMECEEADRTDGTKKKRQKTEEWDPWDIMHRWLQRNKRYLSDGDWGVLGKECIVDRDNGAVGTNEEQVIEIKHRANNKIEEVGTALEAVVKQILKELDSSSAGESMDSIIKKVKQGKDSASTAPKVKDDVAPPPPPPPPPSGPSMPSSPDVRGREGPGESGTAQTVSKPAPANTQPVKPVHSTSAKPVAAKPAPSGAGGTQAIGTADAKATECQGDKLLEWTPREIYVVQNYTKEQWKPVKEVLEEFIKYLGTNNENFDALGANCDNTGWNDFDDVAYYTGQRVADMMRCRLMSGALWFANGAGTNQEEWAKKSEDQKKEIERLRCEVAHVFGHLLKKMYCKDTTPWPRGIEYAWQTMKEMGHATNGAPGLRGPVVDGRCTMCGYKDNKKHVTAINLDIAYWLMDKGGILEELKQLEHKMPCQQLWQQYIKKAATKGDPIETILTTEGMNEKKRLHQQILQTAEKVFEKAKDKVQEEIENLQGKNTHVTNTAEYGRLRMLNKCYGRYEYGWTATHATATTRARGGEQQHNSTAHRPRGAKHSGDDGSGSGSGSNDGQCRRGVCVCACGTGDVWSGGEGQDENGLYRIYGYKGIIRR
ncbi:hypothetical protein AK88_02855 [Plasmodium fragile]|uniref:Schizont-infected cell agglutination extracellular alpha domain-containing protein n=1 Tax=Plasmodium fragile TaxID=5857 RepID=A0A0D9QPB2_PLAFR|nr:uncharacterized protein AK88_02855 [Plasmodium fragile]KJP87551.1 hypothetical protein AK88_02855 [Plasmodium fragile]